MTNLIEEYTYPADISKKRGLTPAASAEESVSVSNMLAPDFAFSAPPEEADCSATSAILCGVSRKQDIDIETTTCQ